MHSAPSVLAIDIGTSACKCIVFSETGAILSQGRAEYSLYKVGDRWVEQDPMEILNGIRQSVSNLSLSQKERNEIKAISFSAQIASQFLVDSQGIPLTKMLSWMDRRAEAELAEYNDRFSPNETLQMTDMDMVMTTAHTTIKLRWMKKHIPDILAQASHVVQIKDFVIHDLTGNWVSDSTSLKGIVAQRDGKPIDPIMDFIGIKPTLLPMVMKPYDVAGSLRAGVDGFADFAPGIPVIVGWNDMNAAFLGMAGLPGECMGIDLTGTSEHVGIVVPRQTVPDCYRLSGINRVPFLDEHEVFYGVTSSGGLSYEWFLHTFMPDKDLDMASLHAAAYALGKTVDPVDARELLFMPFLEGERHPWNEPNACGVFYGLRKTNTLANMYYAILEGVAFVIRAILESAPIPPRQLIVSGGASRNHLWNQIKANVTGLPVFKLAATEAGCNGAAILAKKQLLKSSSMREIAQSMIQYDKRYTPQEKYQALYEDKYRRFLRLLHTVEPLWHIRVK